MFDRIRRHRDEHGCDEALELALAENLRLTEIIRTLLPHDVATATVALDNRKDTTMPLDLFDDDSAAHTATVNYLKADGTPYTGPTAGFTVAFTDSDTTVATTDPTTGAVTLTHADGTDQVGAVITLPDSTVITATPDAVTVAPRLPASATVTVA